MSAGTQSVGRRHETVHKTNGSAIFDKRFQQFDVQQLFNDVLGFTRETVRDPKLSEPRQRVRYWAALTLLRSLMSSPAAAAKAFAVREQKLVEQAKEAEEQEDLGERETLDPVDVESISDTVPEAPVELGAADLEEGSPPLARLCAAC